ncbi:Na+:H+ antiporter, NhaA family [Thermosyntropha lipolytica DSM 11003]|uniref:Na(+)/H(+) antiporter NhaA n=1 Tax=Thermosyntropha lipolytica DSM 11003 TaxID=1123382 RepID=A0A1M5LWY1_9FIRM|nr:Na+/H+ antiporter NhaA [Thermosyntropha lipolytica]SHG69159.1 Na+:H+ antiporter, NhaA family [Thermosyntropha lipolytica DSM 11003]
MKKQTPFDLYLLQPIRKFLDAKLLSSGLLLLATITALIWANSAYAASYFALWKTEVSFQIGNFVLSDTLGHWINDGLMVIFFFVIGLEIKREFMVGELSSFKKASLPMLAALGGMVVPAIFYIILNAGTDSISGWGIPMATDIAFALGALMLLGNRVPLALKVFLLALAVVDDLGAILVIAIFYTEQISTASLITAFVFLGISLVLNAMGVRRTWPYALLGLFLWLAFLQSGVHATIAGVLMAFTIPSRAKIGAEEFKNETYYLLEQFPEKEFQIMCTDENQYRTIEELKYLLNKINTPLQRLEHALQPVASYFIIPVFALANAGVNFTSSEANIDFLNPITLGIILGLVVGKQLGITLFSYLGVKAGIAFLPSGITFKHIYGVSCLAGIGFTMSLFITNLAFVNPVYIEEAKIGILSASLLSAIIGIITLSLTTDKECTDEKVCLMENTGNH